MDYQASLEYLSALGHEVRDRHFDLQTIQRLAEALGHPEQNYPTAVVAGTNGKGSTSAILASILRQAGYRTGLYTSPHLVRVNERIQLNGEPCADEEFAAAVSSVAEAAARLAAGGGPVQPPSFFEIVTAAAFLHFARARAEFVVLEVGMGGRLDATNITRPRVAVITNIDYDHTEFLGDTLEAIAGEKAGVIKPGTPVISGCEVESAAQVIRQRCAALGAPLMEVAQLARLSRLEQRGGRYAFDLVMNGDGLSGLEPGLAGRFQVKNTMTAVGAAWQLARQGFAIRPEDIREGVHTARWPGRLETVAENPWVVLDGAHNPAGARAVAEFLRTSAPGRPVRLVFACSRDKAIGEMSDVLFPCAAALYLTTTPSHRSATPREILQQAKSVPPHCIEEPDPVAALARAWAEARDDEMVMATGSLFLVGAIRQALLEGRLRFASGHAHGS